jgi:hypothetical protein
MKKENGADVRTTVVTRFRSLLISHYRVVIAFLITELSIFDIVTYIVLTLTD